MTVKMTLVGKSELTGDSDGFHSIPEQRLRSLNPHVKLKCVRGKSGVFAEGSNQMEFAEAGNCAKFLQGYRCGKVLDNMILSPDDGVFAMSN